MSSISEQKSERAKAQEIIKATELAGYRNGFLPQAMKKMAMVAIINASLSMILIVCLTAIYIFRPQPDSFAISPSGRIVKMIPLSEDVSGSGLGQNVIASFVANAIIDSYSIDFLNWKKQLASLSKYYTPDGYNNFMVAIEQQKDKVVSGRYITQVSLITAPVVEKTAIVNGILKYKISMDIIIELQSENKRIPADRWHIVTIVRRVPFSVNPVGVSIENVVATTATAQQ